MFSSGSQLLCLEKQRAGPSKQQPLEKAADPCGPQSRKTDPKNGPTRVQGERLETGSEASALPLSSRGNCYFNPPPPAPHELPPQEGRSPHWEENKSW